MLAIILSLSLAAFAHAASVTFPNYIYPLQGQWQPLYDALEAAPDVTFRVIVNPSSGAGASADRTYQAEVKKLASYPNAVPVGYIYVNWADRPAAEVKKELQNYKSWYPEVEGIFFDEAPAESADEKYMADVAAAARSTIPGAYVIYNPGTSVSSGYFTSADQIVVAEHGISGFKANMPNLPKSAAMLYDVPANRMESLVTETKDWGAVYFTGSGNSYKAFGSDWMTFVNLLQKTTGGSSSPAPPANDAPAIPSATASSTRSTSQTSSARPTSSVETSARPTSTATSSSTRSTRRPWQHWRSNRRD